MKTDWRTWRAHHLLPTSHYPIGLEIVRSEGPWLWDRAGNRYWDLISGISVNLLGHRPPEVLEAIRRQSEAYLHVMVWGDFWLEPQVQYAQRLTEDLPPELNTVIFTTSGSEAIELALKAARKATRRQRIVAFYRAYHGSTLGAWSLLNDPQYRIPFQPLLPGVTLLPFNTSDEELDRVLTEDVAAVVMEVIQGEAGVYPAQDEFLRAVRRLTRERQILLVFDEIQTGFYRTGYTCYRWEYHKVMPDMLVLAKALGGGLPLGAVISSHTILETLIDQPSFGHISTFGGHPLSCTAGLAFYELLHKKKETFPAQIQAWETYLVQPLREEGIPVRWFGFMGAVDLPDAQDRISFLRAALQKGYVVDFFLWNPVAIRIYPPAILAVEQIQEIAQDLVALICQFWRQSSVSPP